MRIEDFYSAPVKPAEPNTQSDKTAETDQQRLKAEGDQVTLSRLSAALSKAGADEQQIRQLRLEVEAGSYRVPESQVSRSIVEYYLEPSGLNLI